MALLNRLGKIFRPVNYKTVIFSDCCGSRVDVEEGTCLACYLPCKGTTLNGRPIKPYDDSENIFKYTD